MKPLGKRHTQLARQHMAEKHGVEMTPDELSATRKSAYETIRRELRKAGLPAPDSDEELFRLIQKHYKPKE